MSFLDEKKGVKLTDADVVLMKDYRASVEQDYDDICAEIVRLENRKRELKRMMSKRHIADMFEITESYCHRIFKGEYRGDIG